MPRNSFYRSLLIVTLTIVTLRCSDDPMAVAGFPASLLIVAGDDQSGVVGAELTNALVVRVVDSAGAPVAGQLVSFVVTAGGGHPFAGASITNVNGLALERWTLGTSIADSQRFEARAVDNATGQRITFAVFRATATADAPDTVRKVSGDAQTAETGTPLADSLVVRVADRYGNPVNGATVTWNVLSGGGSVSPTSVTANGAGLAAARWTVGAEGSNQARASSAAASPASFTAGAYVVPRYRSVSAGLIVTCGLGVDSVAYCWGAGRLGALGSSSGPAATCTIQGSIEACSTAPVRVQGSTKWSSVGTGGQASCGLAAGAVSCWGTNYSGLLGGGVWSSGNPSAQPVPAPVAGGLTFSGVAVGTHHNCALTSAGAAYCWGSARGALGIGSSPDSANVPTAVVGGQQFQSLAVGMYGMATCGIVAGGAAFCWGDGGRLGVGDTVTRTAPAAVAGGLSFGSISLGQSHACGLTLGGSAYCWGERTQVGHAVPPVSALAPVAVEGGLTFSTISVGFGHSCALTLAGAAYCWGFAGDGGFGGMGSALGDGTDLNRPTPTAVAGGLTFQSISAGVGNTCATTAAGEIYCWGTNVAGQLGDGTTTGRTQPVRVTHPLP